MSQSIYEKYGGYPFFHDCIYALYLDMFDHPEIAYHFIGVDIAKLSHLQAQYLTRAIGGPNYYDGRDVKALHADMKITPFQFGEIAQAFRGIFLKRGVSPADVEIIMHFILKHKKVIVTAESSPMDKVMRPVYGFARKYLAKYLPKDSSWLRKPKK